MTSKRAATAGAKATHPRSPGDGGKTCTKPTSNKNSPGYAQPSSKTRTTTPKSPQPPTTPSTGTATAPYPSSNPTPKHLNMNNTTLVLITLTALLLTQIIGIPTWHYATALLINA